jgi:putative hydroxymethylpyrimidine transport system substrate-binding protein
VIARDRDAVRTAADLAGKTVGVTGVPSDELVLDTVLRSAGVDPSDVKRITIGFNAVSALAAGRIHAATAFWNAEGVELKELGIPTREFRVDEFGAPRYPELVLVTTADTFDEAGSRCGVGDGLDRGYQVLMRDPELALQNLLDSVPGLDAASQRAQFEALLAGDAFRARGRNPGSFEIRKRSAWAAWASSSVLEDREGTLPFEPSAYLCPPDEGEGSEGAD